MEMSRKEFYESELHLKYGKSYTSTDEFWNTVTKRCERHAKGKVEFIDGDKKIINGYSWHVVYFMSGEKSYVYYEKENDRRAYHFQKDKLTNIWTN